MSSENSSDMPFLEQTRLKPGEAIDVSGITHEDYEGPKPRKTRRSLGDLSVHQTEKSVLEVAKRLADGDLGRIEYHKDGTVTVHNNSNWRKKR